MKITICGCGVVGRATAEGFARLGHEVYTYDINPEASDIHWWGKQLLDPRSPEDCQVVFFCTPEEAAEKAVRDWSGDGLRVVRSSTLPGTVAALAKSLKMPVAHNPEFLREATALQDFLNPAYVLIGDIGLVQLHPQLLDALYRPFRAPIIHTDPTTSEMVKLATNGLLATLIAYWSDIGGLCQALGVNSHQVGMIASRDPRVPAYGARQHGQPYGGRCLPKDIQHLLALAKRHLGPDVHREVPILAGVSKWSE